MPNMPLVAEIMVNHGGGGAPSGPGVAEGGNGGDGDKETRKNTKDTAMSGKKTQKTLAQTLGKTLGISVGISSILKQSQVFTGYIGTIFQLMGALVDVILAPFLPIMIPAIKLLAQIIPIIGQWVRKGVDFAFKWAGKLWGVIKNLPIIKGLISKIPANTGKFLKKALAAILMGAFAVKLFMMWRAGRTATTTLLTMIHGTLQTIAMTGRMGGKAMGGGMGKLVKGGRMSRMIQKVGIGRLARGNVLMLGMSAVMMRGFAGLTGVLRGGFSAMKGASGFMAGEVTKLAPRMVTPVVAAQGLVSKAIANSVRIATVARTAITAATKTGLSAVKTGLGTAWSKITAGAKTGFNVVKTGLGNVAKKFPNVTKALGVAKTAITKGLGVAKTAITKGLTTAKTAITKGLTTLGTKLSGVLNAAKNLAAKALTTAKNLAGKAATTAKNVASKAVTTAKNTAGKVGGFFKSGFSKVSNVVAKATGGGAAAASGKAGGGLFGGLKKGLTKAVQTVAKPLTAMAKPLAKVAPGLIRGAKFLPGINVIAEAGYGIYKTVADTKKYGWRAGMARAAFSATAVGAAALTTGLTGVGGIGATVASGAYSIGGHYALDKAFEKGKLGARQQGPPIVVNNIIASEAVPPWQLHQEVHQNNSNEEITVNSQANFGREGH